MIEYIQSALLIIAAILTIISAIGILSLGKDTKNVVYARIHIVGIFDVACIIAMIAIGVAIFEISLTAFSTMKGNFIFSKKHKNNKR